MVKPLIIAGISVLVGLVAGLVLHAYFFDARSKVQCLIQRDVAWSRGSAMVSIPALLALERGDTSTAEKQLARNIATYQLTWGQQNVTLPGLPDIDPLIRSAIDRSPMLREELNKKKSE